MKTHIEIICSECGNPMPIEESIGREPDLNKWIFRVKPFCPHCASQGNTPNSSSQEPEYLVPHHVMAEWERQCTCCRDCGQDVPCGGVMAGGMCDEMCECDEIQTYEPF